MHLEEECVQKAVGWVLCYMQRLRYYNKINKLFKSFLHLQTPKMYLINVFLFCVLQESWIRERFVLDRKSVFVQRVLFEILFAKEENIIFPGAK
jgi:hypothetical protein